MANATTFAGSGYLWKTFNHKPTSKPAIESLAIKTTCRFRQNRLKSQRYGFPGQRNGENILLNGHKLNPVMALKRNNGDSNSNQLSPSDIVKEFYRCINEKKFGQLCGYIAEDCCLEECSFFTPLQGKEVKMPNLLLNQVYTSFLL